MPIVNGQRVLNTDPRYTSTLNARGGIDKVSRAELAGTRPQGSTGTVNALEVVPRLNPTIPEVIPSTALAGNKTFEDVMDTRADLETQATAKQQLTDRIKGTTERVGAPSTSSFSNPDAIINRLALNRVPTETESMRTQKQNLANQTQRNFAGDIATARTQANEQFGVPDLVARKAEITQQYAEREAQLDADIKRIEDNASKRGVDRAAVEDMKRATKSAALEDLANYAAIEAAVSGSITEARSIINDTINDKKDAFQMEYQAIQDDIDYYNTLVGEENQRTAQTLQIALDEKKRLDNAQLAKETAIKSYMVEAAKEGADDGTINAILKSGTEEEALRYAAPWLGKLDRESKQASAAASWALANERNEVTPGSTFNSPSGPISIPTFDDWAEENGGRLWQLGGTEEQMDGLKQEYNDEISVMQQAAKVASLSPLAREVVNNPQAYYDFTATQKGEIFEELSKAGLDTNNIIAGKKRPLPATQVTEITQAQGVREDVQTLYTKLKALPGTGPIGGRLQALDPWNAQRVEIEALITSIVPGLARGIFNEVGVLTDTDVTRYRDTLANPNMTDEQIELLHSQTMSKVEQSISLGLNNYSLAGYAVDKFLEAELPEQSEAGGTDADPLGLNIP